MKMCDCGGCDEQSKINFVDYDSLIEELQETRDKINNLIKILEHKKLKDDAINQILLSNYDDESQQEQQHQKQYQEQQDDELLEILEKILEKIGDHKVYDYRYPYQWYDWKKYPRYYTTSFMFPNKSTKK